MFQGIQLRRNEKKLLNDINGDKDGRLRFHVLADNGRRKKRIQTREEKIFVLVNDCLTGDPMVHDLSLSQVLVFLPLGPRPRHSLPPKLSLQSGLNIYINPRT